MKESTAVRPVPASIGRGSGRRSNRLIAFGLSAEQWDLLVDLATSEGRDPEQQARWIVLQCLRVYADELAS